MAVYLVTSCDITDPERYAPYVPNVLPLLEKHGAEVVAVWQSLEDSNTLIWMLAYRDRAHREEVWAAFRADPEWIALRAKYPVGVSSQVFMMSASDYSALK